ncbi:MAG: tRNA (adenosine(37)-N6)-threonylcarbamoyltransferase complex transferase subunit TsaD [Patescibacteria group bacterium]
MNILGIESSCDDTAVSVVHATQRERAILSHVIASQIATHRRYGGVVPEVAARKHVINIIPAVDYALKQSGVAPKKIDAIAVTVGPGLVTSLRIGVQTAKALSLAWGKKIISINHMEGHLYANWHGRNTIPLPALCLVVSGGHTDLMLIKRHGAYSLIGRTRDDAAGEAFDKVAKMLRLSYPGGPEIQKLGKRGDPAAFTFPRPMLTHSSYDFSFSGLKTAVLYMVRQNPRLVKTNLPDICASFQRAVTDVLIAKTVRAAQALSVRSVLLAGGVAANAELRLRLGCAVRETLGPHALFTAPPPEYCTDNASMIAIAGYYRRSGARATHWKTLEANPNWELV